MKSIRALQLKGKRVLLRCDLNVPVENGAVRDDFRLEQSIPTIEYITKQEGKCVILAHLGRPAPFFATKNGEFPKEFSLEPIGKSLERLLSREVKFIKDPVGQEVRKQIDKMKPGEIALLENIRLYEGEEVNDEHFAEQLASLGDVYVNDAFGVCHRAHASVAGVPRFLPAAAGLLVEKEVEVLSKVRENPAKPLVVLVGGTKVETKASFLSAIAKHASAILVGNLLSEKLKEKGVHFAPDVEVVYAKDGVDGNFDLGPATLKVFAEKIRRAKTIFWAGPLGKIEEGRYEKGSLAVAQAILETDAFAVAGGGDLAAFLGKHGLRGKFAHVSTGGGAMLAFLAGEELPGLEALEQ